jgi:hypothetical protein
MRDAMAQLPPVLVCGLTVRLDDEDDVDDEPRDDVPLLDVAETTLLVFVACASLHAIAPPKVSTVATLAAPTARLVRCARGFLWSLIAGSRAGSRVLD